MIILLIYLDLPRSSLSEHTVFLLLLNSHDDYIYNYDLDRK